MQAITQDQQENIDMRALVEDKLSRFNGVLFIKFKDIDSSQKVAQLARDNRVSIMYYKDRKSLGNLPDNLKNLILKHKTYLCFGPRQAEFVNEMMRDNPALLKKFTGVCG